MFITLLVFGCSSLPAPQYKNMKPITYFDHQQIEKLGNHLAFLSADNMAGRRFSSPEIIAAQNYIISSLINSDVQPFQNQFRHPFKHESFLSLKQGHNIIGYVKGTVFPNQFIVLSAHYDHLGKKGAKIYNGADDNASGTAALLAFAEIVNKAPMKHSVIFLFTDGEEVNLLGAKAFINQQKDLLPQIKLNINIDMIAGSKNTNKLHFIEHRLEQVLSQDKIKDFKGLPNNSTIKLKRGFKRDSYRGNSRISWTSSSDHGPFNRAHIPFIYFGVGMHDNYHTTHDDFDNVNLEFYIQACQSIFQYLNFFDENITLGDNKNLTN